MHSSFIPDTNTSTYVPPLDTSAPHLSSKKPAPETVLPVLAKCPVEFEHNAGVGEILAPVYKNLSRQTIDPMSKSQRSTVCILSGILLASTSFATKGQPGFTLAFSTCGIMGSLMMVLGATNQTQREKYIACAIMAGTISSYVLTDKMFNSAPISPPAINQTALTPSLLIVADPQSAKLLTADLEQKAVAKSGHLLSSWSAADGTTTFTAYTANGLPFNNICSIQTNSSAASYWQLPIARNAASSINPTYNNVLLNRFSSKHNNFFAAP